MSHGRESAPTFSYMDGIPVKISEKYKPPRKVTLPVGFQQRLGHETLSEEYDFRLEHSVLKKMGEWRALRTIAKETLKERIKAHDTVHQEQLSDGVQKLSVKPGERKFETTISDSTGSSNCTYSHPTVSSVTSNDITYPDTISSCRVVFSNSSQNVTPSSVSYPNLEVGSRSINVGSNSSKVSRQNMQYSHRTSILTPVPISQMSSSIDSSKSSSQFNISDFEADTSSPFDNMELKTINEMEELAHVLQPVSNSPNKNDSSRSDVDLGNRFSPQTNYNLNQDTVVHYNTVGSKSTKESIVLSHLNGLTGYSSYNSAPRLKERDMSSENYATSRNNVFDHRTNMPQNLGNMYGFYPHQPWNVNVDLNHPSAYQASGNGDVKPNIAANSSCGNHVQPVEALSFVASENTKPLTSGMSFPSTYNQLPRNDDQHSPGRTLSKSVPDIVQELEKELAEKHVAERSAAAVRTSHTPPPRPNSFGSTGLEDWKPWPDLDSPEQSQTRGKKSPVKKNAKENLTVLPNPFHELPVAIQHIAFHISEMGFALPRVARACKLFGDDDKKVVEFLLQVQTLEEQKWSGDLAERALIINDCDIPEAVKYLEALTQLLDLGFPEDKVSEALVKFKNDRDKALDHLIS